MKGLSINKKLFFPTLLILVAVVVIVTINLTAVQENVGNLYDFCIDKFGWFFIVADVLCLVFSLWIMLGPYKDVRLGGADCKPAFSTFSWSGMMFTTSCGAWLIVYGFLEPIYCASQAPFQLEPLSVEAMEFGQAYAHFHWGPNAWCIYVPISIAIGYILYNRHEKDSAISAVCKDVFGTRWAKVGGYLADLFGTLGSVVAPVISLGTGMPLLITLSKRVLGIETANDATVQLGIFLVWVVLFGTSVVLGLKKGIKRLSNINIVMAFIIMLIVGLFVGVSKVFAAELNSVGVVLNNYIRMTCYTDPFGSGSFVRGWTVSYWACYFVYMPLMGIFNAKISKGRKLKEIAFGQLVLCSLGCFAAMATFGNYSMYMQSNSIVDVAGVLNESGEAAAVLAVVDTMPASKIFAVVLLIILFVFLATTMDSSSFVVAEITSKHDSGKEEAPRILRVFWAVFSALLAFVILQIGGAKAVRSLCYIMGVPLAVIAIIIMVAVLKMLKEDTRE